MVSKGKRPRRWEDEGDEVLGGVTELSPRLSVERPTLELTEAVCRSIRAGHGLRSACARWGVSQERLRDWYVQSYERVGSVYEEFRLRVEESRSESEMELVGVLMKAATGRLEPLRTVVRGESEGPGGVERYEETREVERGVDTGAARWLLSKLHSESYGERVEHVHTGSVKHIVVSDGLGWASVEAEVVPLEFGGVVEVDEGVERLPRGDEGLDE